MPSPLKVRLTSEEKQCLFELKSNPKIPQRTKHRAEALVLSDRGWKVSVIAVHLNCAQQTVRQTFYRWLTQGKEGLFDSPRSGRRPVWTTEDIKYIEECLEKEERTYNSRQLVEKLKQERSVEISHDRLRKILKKKSGNGKGQG
uniref:helix-turn-helix domain-containing protein n=1 Tax=Okeania sp. SIO2F4 TaxID=2607790 RepID=UPI0025CCBB8E|nr:helix-turn-helix domain-containing protein [Okeania sp. SIO2F4]